MESSIAVAARRNVVSGRSLVSHVVARLVGASMLLIGNVMDWHEQDDGRCLELGCFHAFEAHCSKKCETEGDILQQLKWLQRSGWEPKKPWMAKVVYTSKGLS